MNSADDIEHAIAELHITTKAETDNRILDDAYVALGKGLEKQRPGTWRKIVSSRITWPAAAAAVILMALALLLSVPSRRFETIEEFYSTLGAVGNICASSFEAGQTEPFQQVWTSQTLKIKLFKIGSKNQARFVLWDIPNKVRMIRYLSSNSVQTEVLTNQMLAELEKSMPLFFGVVPFSDVNDVPQDAQWNHIDDSKVVATVPGTKVYDLIWLQKSTPSETVMHKKWRIFVDTRTNLPKRAEWYAKLKPEDEYGFETFIAITYPSEDEIQALIRSTFGPPESRPGGPEYMPTPGTDR